MPHVDDIPCALNPLQACDLKQVLLLTPEDRRFVVACAFAALEPHDIFDRAGLVSDSKHGDKQWQRWTGHEHRIPLGAAFRVAKVLGVPCEVLFASRLWFEQQ